MWTVRSFALSYLAVMERQNYPRMSAAVENFDCILGQALADFHRSGIMLGQSFDAARKLKMKHTVLSI